MLNKSNFLQWWLSFIVKIVSKPHVFRMGVLYWDCYVLWLSLHFPFLEAKVYENSETTDNKDVEKNDVREQKYIDCATHDLSHALPYQEICLFCHVTVEGYVIVGGQRPEEFTWELAAFNITVIF